MASWEIPERNGGFNAKHIKLYIYMKLYEYFPLPRLIPGRVFWGFKPLQIYLCQFSKISPQIE